MKTRPVQVALLLLALPLGSTAVVAQSLPTVIKAKKIYTVTSGTIENGQILIEGGKIQQVGTKVDAPAGAREFSAEVVIPGMIDAHSHMALDRSFGGNRPPGPVTAEWKAVDHFDPTDPMIPIALSGGVTSMITRSGSGIISSGQAVAVKLKGDPSKDMILKPYVDLKMAIRPLIRLRPDRTPATVMGWYATASEYFRRAKAYLKDWEDYEAGKRDKPEVNERLEAFAAVVRGDVMVHLHSHYPGEVMMGMHLARRRPMCARGWSRSTDSRKTSAQERWRWERRLLNCSSTPPPVRRHPPSRCAEVQLNYSSKPISQGIRGKELVA